MRWKLLGATSLSALAFSQAAFAADVADEANTVDPVTVIATRTEKPLSEVPATVSVISAQQIEDNLVTDIKDLVRYEPGISVRNSPTRFTAAQPPAVGRDGAAGFSIRGLGGNRVLIQVDGVRTPDEFSFGAQWVGRGDYGDLDLMKSVEILRGPGSAMYGSDGVAGAVSFVTKDPSDLLKDGQSWGAQVKGGYATADESLSTGVLGAVRQGRFSGLLAYTRRDGHEQETAGANDVTGSTRTTANPQDIGSNAVLAKGVFEISDDNRLRVTLDHYDRDVDTDVSSARTATTLELLATDETRRDRISVEHRYIGHGDRLDRATWSLYYQDSTTEQFTAEDRTTTDRTRRNTFDNKVFGLTAEGRSTLEGSVENHLIYGLDFSRTRQEGIRDGTVPPAGETFPTRAFPITDYTLAGLFIQDEIALLDGRLSLYPALRYDWFKLDPKIDAFTPTIFTPTSLSDDHVSPKLGVVYRASDAVRVFANYALGFKAPSPSQVNNAFANPSQGYESIPNPNLKPETSETFEAGVRWTNPRWSTSFTAFTGQYDDFIEQVVVSGSFTPITDPAIYQYVNLSEATLSGAEAKVQFQGDNGFGFIAAASMSRGESTDAGVRAPLDSIDPFKIVAGFTYRDPGDKFGGQASVTHSDRKDEGRTSRVCTPSCYRPDAFSVLDLTAYWNINEAATLRVGVFNVTDETYSWWSDVPETVGSTSASIDAYTQPGRNASISLSARF